MQDCHLKFVQTGTLCKKVTSLKVLYWFQIKALHFCSKLPHFLHQALENNSPTIIRALKWLFHLRVFGINDQTETSSGGQAFDLELRLVDHFQALDRLSCRLVVPEPFVELLRIDFDEEGLSESPVVARLASHEQRREGLVSHIAMADGIRWSWNWDWTLLL